MKISGEFPRSDGKAKVHHIPAYAVSRNSLTDLDISEDLLDNGINFLIKSKTDLVNGDFVVFEALAGYRNEGVAVYFEGRLHQLYFDLDDYGSIPPYFRVIEDDVPIDYWRFIDHNFIVWFDATLLGSTLVDNIEYSLVDSKWTLFTRGKYGSRIITIVYDYTFDMGDDKLSDEDLNNLIAAFRHHLATGEVMPYSFYSEAYGFDPNTIYVGPFMP